MKRKEGNNKGREKGEKEKDINIRIKRNSNCFGIEAEKTEKNTAGR